MRGQFTKIVLVVLDGLRPDAITPETMPVLHGLLRQGWQAQAAVTVRPSITVAALTSLATGVDPAQHGLVDTRIQSFSRIAGLKPLPLELRRLGVETTVVTTQLSGAARWMAGALLRVGGVTRLLPSPPAPGILLDIALRQVEGNSQREFIVVYLNDTDVAGHAWGWMTPAYLQAALTIDRAMMRLVPRSADPNTLMIIAADHGGGGVLLQDHDHPHPLNDRIPVGMLGGRVMPGLVSPEPVSLLDIPPTVISGFGGTAPAQYQGRMLHEAFLSEVVWA